MICPSTPLLLLLYLTYSSFPYISANIIVLIRTNNKGGPHNVVFDEDGIPAGVDQEKISMDDQLGEEGDTFTMKLDKAGTYDYYCEPHRGAGMNAQVIVQ